MTGSPLRLLTAIRLLGHAQGQLANALREAEDDPAVAEEWLGNGILAVEDALEELRPHGDEGDGDDADR